VDTKKHFWVDYLACLIFGAVIVPLWFFLENYPSFGNVGILPPDGSFRRHSRGLFCGSEIAFEGKRGEGFLFFIFFGVFFGSVYPSVQNVFFHCWGVFTVSDGFLHRWFF